MYDEPAKENPAKKKTKRRRKAAGSVDDDEPLVAFAEASCSSSHMMRRAARREKKATDGKEQRFWARRRLGKEEQMIAHYELLSIMTTTGALADQVKDGASDQSSKPLQTKRRASEGKIRRERVRRKARLESQTSRCYSLEDDRELEDRELYDTPCSETPQTCSQAKCDTSDGKGRQTAADPFNLALPFSQIDEHLAPTVHALSAKQARRNKDKACSVM